MGGLLECVEFDQFYLECTPTQHLSTKLGSFKSLYHGCMWLETGFIIRSFMVSLY